MAKLTNPLIDTIFKIIFGKEGVSEEFLIDFLNQVFSGDPEFDEIISVKYGNPERVENDARSKKVIYDIHCTTSTGHRFLVEMQRANQRNFLKRMLYYISRLITDQVKHIKEENKRSEDANKKSEYDYMPVVGVFICDFVIDGAPKKPLVRCVISDEESGKAISRDIRMAFVQLPLFEKEESECETGFDMWIYNLKNMERLDTLPFAEYKNQLFKRLEKVTNYAALSEKEQAQYDEDVKWARDYEETVLYQYDKGLSVGRAEGIAEGELQQAWKDAKKMWDKKFDYETISDITGLSVAELKEKL